MTLSELSIRNAKRQMRDYLVYFITITISASLIYAFNSLVVSKEIKGLSKMLVNLPLTVVMASVVVVFIIGWLVYYTMRFILTKRSRELGTYILLGIENKQVAQLFFMENLVIGAGAFIVGTILGNLIFQYMCVILMRLFEAPYHFSLSFSWSAIGLTLMYFALIYFFALIRNRKRIRRMKIYDLIYFDKQNETNIIKKSKNRRILFIVSILFGITGTWLLGVRDLYMGFLGAGLIIIFLYGFFTGFSSGVSLFFEKRPVRKYTGTNLLVYRSLTSKLTTMGITMATIAVLFTATMISEGMGILFGNQFQRNVELTAAYDLHIGSTDVRSGFDEYKEYIDANISVRDAYEYYIYLADGDAVMQYIESETADYFKIYEKDTLLRLSDYNALRKMLGYSAAHTAPDSYIIHCMDYLEDTMEQFHEPLDMGGRTLDRGGIYTENFAQDGWDGNGRHYIIVIPDEIAETYEPLVKIYAAMTNEPVIGETFEALREMRLQKANMDPTGKSGIDTVMSIAAIKEEYTSMVVMIIFPLFYLAVILTMAAATILTIQLLSDVNKYRKQYRFLHNMGMDRRDMTQTLRRQFILFFTMPAIPPLLISIVFMHTMGSLFDQGIIVSRAHLWGIIGMTAALFLAVYLVYIAASYISFKRNVLQE